MLCEQRIARPPSHSINLVIADMREVFRLSIPFPATFRGSFFAQVAFNCRTTNVVLTQQTGRFNSEFIGFTVGSGVLKCAFNYVAGGFVSDTPVCSRCPDDGLYNTFCCFLRVVQYVHCFLLIKNLLQGPFVHTASRIAACVSISNGSEYNSVTVVTNPPSRRMVSFASTVSLQT